jgi:hypothetical protein
VHSIPQPPQFAVEACVFVSQPFVASPSQFPNPTWQTSTTHAPEEHPGVPFCTEHTTSQPPQFWTSALVGSSQPFAASPSQLSKPTEHVNEHAPEEHAGSAFAGAWQAFPHALQFEADVLRFTSQPSSATPLQSSNPASHPASEHTPAEHSAVPFGAEHTFPQPPQFWTSALVGCSQPVLASPSQSSNPASHTSAHAPDWHTAVPFGPLGQTLEHAPQWSVDVSRLASHPFAAWLSQSSNPASHWAIPQLIWVQAPVAFAGSHASPQKAQSVSVPRSVSQPFASLLSQLALPAAHTRAQVPVTHVAPGGHASPQPPQFWGSTEKAASQPFATSTSQLVKPGSHTSIAQIPATHAGVAFGTTHGFPQPPHWAGSLWVSTSQPFAASSSQFEKLPSHAPTAHAPASHAAVAFGIEHGSHPFSAHPNAGSLTATHASPQSFSSLAHGAAPP